MSYRVPPAQTRRSLKSAAVRVDREGSAVLFCTDGLTKHVSDDEIATAIAEEPSSEDVCRTLLGLALERGGTDNITMVVARRRS